LLGVGVPSGGTSVYSGTGVSGNQFNPSSAGVGTHTISYKYTDAKSCVDSVSTSITVDSVPIVTFSSLPTLCKGDPSITLTQGSPIGGIYSGNNVSLGKYNPSAVGGDSLQYLFTDAKGCKDSLKSFIKVDSVPIISFPTLSNRCLNAGSFTLNTATPTGGVYSGTNVSGGVYTPTIVRTDTIQYFLALSGACKDSVTQTITIDSVPTVSFASISPVCFGAANFTLTGGSPSGGAYSGNNVSSGSYSPRTAGTDTITYSFTDGNSCSATAKSFVVVNSLPTVTFSTLTAVCEGAPAFALSGGAPTGGSYSGNNVSSGSYNPVSAGKDTLKYVYTNSNSCTDSAFSVIQVDTTPKVTLGSFGAICKKAKALTLSSGVPLGGTYFGNNVALNLFIPSTSGVDTIHYTFKDANNCSDTATQSIVVDTLPAVTLASIPNICLNTPSFALSGGSPSGGSYSGKNVISNRYTAANVGLDTIKYSFTDSNTCNAEATGIIQIDSIPIVKLNLGFTQVCENSPKIPLSGGAPLGGTYKGSFVSGTDFDPSLNTPTTSMVYYLYIDSNKCSDSANSQVIVDTIQKVTLASFGAICKLAVPQVLTSGSPSGGVYFGINVNGSSSEFDPSTASLGNSSISYTFTTPKGCEDSAIGNILVEANPTFNLGNDTSICGKDELTLDIGIPFLNYNWNTGDTSRSIKIQKSAIVIVEVTDTSTMANCTYSDTIRVDYDEICVGLNELFANGSIKYFPNPSNGKFYIEFESIELDNMQIQIISMKGEEVFKKEIILNNGIYKGIVEMDNIPSGIYLMNLISDKGFITKRISIR
ncbi:MAG: T9SS type A sorting domain-containing protein, partial [Flavobacteriales bacterium]